jgi:hypothetical protein
VFENVIVHVYTVKRRKLLKISKCALLNGYVVGIEKNSAK